MSEKMREEFEVWVMDQYPGETLGRFNTGEYHGHTLQFCWVAWQASRSAIVVELPNSEELVGEYSREVYRIARDEFCEAIEAAGLKVKS